MHSPRKILFYLTAFSVAMGFMESAVVIYLREIFYKEGFSFPLKPMSPSLALVEVFREAATVIMLIAIGWFAGRTKLQKFAYFNIAFAIWDLVYYIFLYIFLGWPESLFTWDILFLIPFPWVGPVWAPCLLCLLMIAGSLFVIRRSREDPEFRIPKLHWALLIGGAVTCIVAFMWDYLNYLPAGRQSRNGVWTPGSDQDLFSEISGYIPSAFNYPLFFVGFVLMAVPVFYNMYKRP
jgi:hypothetical protein